MIQQAIARLLERQDLSEDEACAALGEIMLGEASQAQIGRFLLGLRMEFGQVAVVSLDFPTAMVADARALGVRSFISKTLTGVDLADAVVDAARGREVVATGSSRGEADPARLWPGRHEGLSERESQVLVLCAEGLSNRQIAEALYVSVDTVKSHLRRAYQRLGIHNRAQAATYVHTSGAFVRVQPGVGR